MWLTAIHCLSSTWPAWRAEALFGGSSALPPLPLTQCLPMSSLKDTSISPSGCSLDASQKALNGSTVWQTRPVGPKPRLGSVVSVQLGGIGGVPVETQAEPLN